MPKKFDRCVKAGNKVRTISGPSDKFNLKNGEYRRVCIKGSGDNRKFIWGHKKTKKEE